MTHRIPDQVVVPLVWNDDESTWEVDYDHIGRRPLEQSTEPDDRTCSHGDPHDQQVCDEIWGRASAADMPTADDLAHMLGSALAHATRDVSGNIAAGQRPPSPALVDMLDGAIGDATPATYADSERRAIIRAILPIVASVDMNAHRRGAAEARANA